MWQTIFLLQYLSRITNPVLYYPSSLWLLLTSQVTSKNEHDWTPVKYLNVLHHNRTQKQLRLSS